MESTWPHNRNGIPEKAGSLDGGAKRWPEAAFVCNAESIDISSFSLDEICLADDNRDVIVQD